MRTILAATDFSTQSNLALERAITLARRNSARLVLVHAFAPITTSRLDLTILPPSFEADTAKLLLDRLQSDAEALNGQGVQVSAIMKRGAPGDILVEVAEEEQAELIVAATRGLGGFEHALLGSVAEATSGKATCPVLVVHENDVQTLDPPRRVLLPTDRTGDVAHVASALENLFGTTADGSPIELVLAHADRVPPLLAPTLGGLTGMDLLPFSQVADSLRELLDPTAAELRERGFAVQVEVVDGESASSMIQLAGRHEVDLIAMSTHGRSAVTRFVLGSTARRVVQHAPCPVLTVRDNSGG